MLLNKPTKKERGKKMSVAKIFKQFSKMSEDEQKDFLDLISKDEEETPQDSEQVVDTKEPQKEDNVAEVKPEEEEQVSEEAKTSEDTNASQQANENVQPEIEESIDNSAVGININDVALKSDIMAQLDAMQAKIDSIVKENKDLKEELSKSQEKANELHNKYERDDFGNQSERNFGEKRKSNPYESADEYLKRFKG